MNSIVYNADCIAGMKQYPDNHFDLAVVDPPYGIGISSNPVRQKHNKKTWDSAIPNDEYFKELFRVSKNQIIWGGNYFPLPPSQGFLIWDKVQPHDFSLAMCEFAWISFQSPAKMYKKSVQAEQGKIHPTQKPITLYDWIYANYLPDGGLVLDTHLGSGSNRISADKRGNIDFVGYEIDKDYFNAQEKRWRDYKSQLTILF